MNNLPPQSIEYEAYVLGSMIMSKSNRLYALDKLKADDFYLENHRIFFDIINNLENANIQVDHVSIQNEFKKRNIDNFPKKYMELTDNWTGSDIKHHVEELISVSQKRQAILAATELMEQCYVHNTSIDDLIFETGNKFQTITQRNSGETISVAEFFKNKKPEDLSRKGQFFRTGFKELDAGIIGLFKGRLTYLAAETSVGKTALATNIAMKICQSYLDSHILWFPLEMSVEDMAERLVSETAKIDSQKIITEKYSNQQKEQLKKAIEKLQSYNNFHFAKNVFSLPGIIKTAKSFNQSFPISVMFVDYMQLVDHKLPHETRERIVADISRTLKQLAMEMYIAIFAISIFNREIGKRKSKEPELSDLKETGAQEYDGNLIMFLYEEDNLEESWNQFLLKVAKNKSGKRKYKIELYYEPEITTFYER